MARFPLVNVWIGSSQRVNRPARENEIVLNGADGLDWETLVKCDLLYLVEKEKLYRRPSPRAGPAHQRLPQVHVGSSDQPHRAQLQKRRSSAPVQNAPRSGQAQSRPPRIGRRPFYGNLKDGEEPFH